MICGVVFVLWYFFFLFSFVFHKKKHAAQRWLVVNSSPVVSLSLLMERVVMNDERFGLGSIPSWPSEGMETAGRSPTER